MDIYVNFFDFYIISFSGFSITTLSYTLILPVSQLQTKTTQMTSHIEYLIQTCNILVLILYSIWPHWWFRYDFTMILDSGLTFWPPCMYEQQFKNGMFTRSRYQRHIFTILSHFFNLAFISMDLNK